MSAITTRDIANLKQRNYNAGGLPDFGEGLAGCGFAEVEDEAVYLGEEFGDFAEPEAKGGGGGD